MKPCTRCGRTDVEFYPSKVTSWGFRSACKTCEGKDKKDWPKKKARNKIWFAKNKIKRAEYHRLKKYNISSEKFDEMFAKQNRSCAICKTTKPGGRNNKWNLDHDHISKRNRGILCYNCNMSLGLMHDSVENLQAAIAYLGASNVIS